MYHIFLSQLSVDWHLCCCHVMVIVNSAFALALSIKILRFTLVGSVHADCLCLNQSLWPEAWKVLTGLVQWSISRSGITWNELFLMHERSQTGTGSFREDMTETWIRGLTHRRLIGGDSMILKGDWSVEFILSLLYFPEKAMATHSSVLAWRIPMDRGSWQATVHRITNSRTGLKWLSMHTHILSQVGERNTKNQERGWSRHIVNDTAPYFLVQTGKR